MFCRHVCGHIPQQTRLPWMLQWHPNAFFRLCVQPKYPDYVPFPNSFCAAKVIKKYELATKKCILRCQKWVFTIRFGCKVCILSSFLCLIFRFCHLANFLFPPPYFVIVFVITYPPSFPSFIPFFSSAFHISRFTNLYYILLIYLYLQKNLIRKLHSIR